MHSVQIHVGLFTGKSITETVYSLPPFLLLSFRGMDAFTDRGSHVSPSQERYTRKEFLMLPPEEKLNHFDKWAQATEDSQEVSI